MKRKLRVITTHDELSPSSSALFPPCNHGLNDVRTVAEQSLDPAVISLRRALANFAAGQKALMIALSASKRLAAERTQVLACLFLAFGKKAC
jgi:hypothetical protein